MGSMAQNGAGNEVDFDIKGVYSSRTLDAVVPSA
jgi:hypothetical protein